MTGVLHNLRLVARDLEAEDKFDKTVRVEHVNACLATLHKINAALSKFKFQNDQTIRNAAHRLKRLFVSADTKALCKEVRRHRKTLSLALSACFSLLKAYHDRLNVRDQMAHSPRASELVELIHEMVVYLGDVRIIVDGLDECGDESALIAEVLHKLASAPQTVVSMAVLSRDLISVREVLGIPSYQHVEVTAHTEDIEHYVRTEIEERRRRLRNRRDDLKEEIVRKLTSKAQGM